MEAYTGRNFGLPEKKTNRMHGQEDNVRILNKATHMYSSFIYLIYFRFITSKTMIHTNEGIIMQNINAKKTYKVK